MRSSFTVDGDPVGKPRMTRADKWQERPAVKRYRDWADAARVAATGNPNQKITEDIIGIVVHAHFAIPESWSKKEKERHYGRVNRSCSDADNILKSAMDALFDQDKTIAFAHAFKFWCEEGAEPRVDIFLLSPPPGEA